MRLPTALRPLIDTLAPVVASWPVTTSVQDVTQWLLQFEPEDYLLAARVLRHLNVIGQDDVRRGLRSAYSRLQRKAHERDAAVTESNTVFLAIGDAGKSGHAIAYDFRIANSLSQENFDTTSIEEHLQHRRIKNIVIIDDVIGSSKTASEEATKVKEQGVPLGVENVFVLAVCGYSDGIAEVEKRSGAQAFAAFTFTVLPAS